MEDTIVAIASPPGQGAVSLIRISGIESAKIAKIVFKGNKSKLTMTPRVQQFGSIINSKKDKLDSVLMTFFQGPDSYTGEDTVEISCHGGMLVTQTVLDVIIDAGARLAEPGEFSKRSFLNGKMDLTQAEAVMDLISARTSLAMRAANSQLDGRLGEQIEGIKNDILGILAHVEAYIDFPEEDISPEAIETIIERLGDLVELIGRLIDSAEQGRILREGLLVAIAGPPNAGKSTLMNAFLGYDRAIVSDIAGTTRDTIEEMANIKGMPVRLIDTAGIREVDNLIEGEGVDRAKKVIEAADLVLLVLDGSVPIVEMNDFIQNNSNYFVVINKNDLGIHDSFRSLDGIHASCEKETGLDEIADAIVEHCMSKSEAFGDDLVAVNSRHRACLESSRKELIKAKDALVNGIESEFVSVDLRCALESVGEIVGKADVEDLLGEIFGSFCIGK